MTSLQAFHASARFGLGPRDGELAAVGADPRGWLLEQMRQPEIPAEVAVRHGGPELTAETIANFQQKNFDKVRRNFRDARDIYIAETGARLQAQAHSTQPFVERMVLFWSNHFTVSIQKPIVSALVNQYEVEAIRPHVTGHFRDMLLAVCRHPAMLLYLDNLQSFGPNSPVGTRRGKGLNENLAREIMELHTLGVDGGYTQDDVIALAKIITGWSINRRPTGIEMVYKYQPAVHEPGTKTLLGKVFSEGGEAEGVDALTMLARHPATARHIATKLARHFIADAPPPGAVRTLERSFMDSDGHLPTVMRTLVEMDDAWAQPLAKVKTAYEFAVSATRLAGLDPTPKQAVVGLEALNFRAFNAPSPAGYDDVAAAWVSSDGLMKRIDWGHRLAQRMPAGSAPLEIAERGLGAALSATTRQAIERAPSGPDGIALLFASPEFQRR